MPVLDSSTDIRWEVHNITYYMYFSDKFKPDSIEVKFDETVCVSSSESTSNISSSIWELYKFAAIILANKDTSLVTSGVTLGFPE